MRRPSIFSWIVLAVVAVLLGCFFVWPLVESLRGAFFTPNGDLTLAYFALLFDNPTYVEGFRNALAVAAATTVLASAVGTSLALALDRWSFPANRCFRH